MTVVMAHNPQHSKNRCYELLPKVSRSFALAIEALPEPLRGYICASYLLCRVVDTIEDHPTLLNKDKYFDLFDHCLLKIEDWDHLQFSLLQEINPPQSWEDELMKSCPEVFDFYFSFPSSIIKILKENIYEMSQGMRDYTARGGQSAIVLTNTSDLDRYCYFVAGTVGNLLTDVFAYHSKIDNPHWISRQKQRGYHFALGLQKVNMIKDIVQDLKRGSLFLPQQWLSQFNVTPQDLLQGQQNPRVQALLYYFIRQATDHLAQSRDYILDLPSDAVGMRLFCIWPYVMALDTLAVATRKTGLFTADHEIKVSRAQMYQMMKLTKVMARQTFGLKFYFNYKLSALREAAAG